MVQHSIFIVSDVVFKKADANIEQTLAKQQADFAKRQYKQKNFTVGDKVLRYNLRRADRKGDKQTDPWDGPYEEDKVCEKGLYCLVNAFTKVPLKTKMNGCNLKPFFESTSNSSPATSTSITQSLPSTSVQITGVEQKEVTHKFAPLMVAIQREICSNSGGQLVFKKKSGPSGKRNKTFKNTSEPLDVKTIEGDKLFFFFVPYHLSSLEKKISVPL